MRSSVLRRPCLRHDELSSLRIRYGLTKIF
jgi:hypothetical protein